MRYLLVWHFAENPLLILRAWLNILHYNFYRFPTGDLLINLFSPWRKYTWSYGRGFSLSRYIEVFTSNIFSRCMGALVRSIVILSSLLSALMIIFFGLLSIIIWFLLPFIGLFLVVAGIVLII
jgi:hypothetical protein